MDAVQLLIDQHRKLEQRLDAALDGYDADGEAQRAKRVAEIGDHLGVHLASEEEVFYPAVKQQSTEDILLESLEEHLSLKRLLADLLALSPQDATFEAKLKVLAEQTEHHHKEEEENLFPKVRKLMPTATLEAVGQQMMELQTRMRRDPDDAPRDVMAEQTERAAPL
jgi:hemerythrin superfamily protein